MSEQRTMPIVKGICHVVSSRLVPIGIQYAKVGKRCCVRAAYGKKGSRIQELAGRRGRCCRSHCLKIERSDKGTYPQAFLFPYYKICSKYGLPEWLHTGHTTRLPESGRGILSLRFQGASMFPTLLIEHPQKRSDPNHVGQHGTPVRWLRRSVPRYTP